MIVKSVGFIIWAISFQRNLKCSLLFWLAALAVFFTGMYHPRAPALQIFITYVLPAISFFVTSYLFIPPLASD